MSEESTAQIAQSHIFTSQELKDQYHRLESSLKATVEAEMVSLDEFERNADKLMETKKEAQRKIFLSVKKLRGMHLANLLVPKNLIEFEQTFDEIEHQSAFLQEQARSYSLCVKIFINIFLHEAKAIKSVDTAAIIEQIESQKKDILSSELVLESCFEKVYKGLKTLSSLCQNEVERFVHVGAVAKVGEGKVLMAQSLADFIVAYEEICVKERETFNYISKFLKENEKEMRRVNEDAAISRRIMEKNKMDMKDFWVYYEPHVKLFHTFVFLSTIAVFVGLGIHLGIVGGIGLKLFNKFVLGKRLKGFSGAASNYKYVAELTDNMEHVV